MRAILGVVRPTEKHWESLLQCIKGIIQSSVTTAVLPTGYDTIRYDVVD